MWRSSVVVSNLLGTVGAIAGGILGFLVCQWIAEQGFYGMMIPGALMGFGCGLLARHKSEIRGILCGLAAFALGLFSEAWIFPFSKDHGFGYFFEHLGDLRPISWVMFIVGAGIAYYLARTPGRFQSVVDYASE